VPEKINAITEEHNVSKEVLNISKKKLTLINLLLCGQRGVHLRS